MGSTIWRNVSSGFAQGPVTSLNLRRGGQVTIQTFWTDEDGVTVHIEPPEEPMVREDAERLGLAVIQLAAIEPPEDLAC
jgi:hypothetical protein